MREKKGVKQSCVYRQYHVTHFIDGNTYTHMTKTNKLGVRTPVHSSERHGRGKNTCPCPNRRHRRHVASGWFWLFGMWSKCRVHMAFFLVTIVAQTAVQAICTYTLGMLLPVTSIDVSERRTWVMLMFVFGALHQVTGYLVGITSTRLHCATWVNARKQLIADFMAVPETRMESHLSSTFLCLVQQDIPKIEEIAWMVSVTGFGSLLQILFSLGLAVYNSNFVVACQVGMIVICLLVKVLGARLHTRIESRIQAPLTTQHREMAAVIRDIHRNVYDIHLTHMENSAKEQADRSMEAWGGVLYVSERAIALTNIMTKTVPLLAVYMFVAACMYHEPSSSSYIFGAKDAFPLVVVACLSIHTQFSAFVNAHQMVMRVDRCTQRYDDWRASVRLAINAVDTHTTSCVLTVTSTHQTEKEEPSESFLVHVAGSPTCHVPALRHDANLLLNKGARILITGRSGVGKSMLVKALSNLCLFARVACVSQKSHMFSKSLHANLLQSLWMPRDPILPKHMQWMHLLLERFGVLDTVKQLPHQLDTMLDPDHTHMSGGQLQRLLLIRAMLSQPDLLILDEFTSALDRETETCICAALFEEKIIPLEQMCVLCISHNRDLAKWFDYSWDIEDTGQMRIRILSPSGLIQPNQETRNQQEDEIKK